MPMDERAQRRRRRIAALTVTLPMFNAMTRADVERAVAAVKAVLAK